MYLLKKLDKPLAIILLFYLLFSFFMITKFPKMWIDDSWNSVAPYTLVTKGRLANPVLKGVNSRDQHLLIPTIFHTVLLAGFYRIFGFGLAQSRALSIIAGFFLILLTYWFAKQYYVKEIAILAIILLIVDNVFFVSVRTVRADIFVALLGTAAFFFFYHGLQTNSLQYFAFSGMAAGVGLYTHPNSVLILVSIVSIFLYKYRLSILLSKEFWAFLLFSGIALAPYSIYVIKEDYANNFSHFWAQLGSNVQYLKRNYLQDFLGEYIRYRDYIYFPKRLLISLVQLAALIYTITSKRRVDKYLAFMAGVFLFLLPLWNPHDRTSRYFIVFIPSLCILVSELFFEIINRISRGDLKTAVFPKSFQYGLVSMIFILYFLNHFGGDVYILFKHRDNDFESFISEVRNTIPQGSKTWGSMTFWMGLHDYPYISEVSPFEEVEKFKPQYAILYDSMNWGGASTIVRRRKPKPDGWSFADRPRKIEKMCEKRGTFIKEINNKFYGNIHIYKIEWEY